MTLCLCQACFVSDFEMMMPFKAARLINVVLGTVEYFLSMIFAMNWTTFLLIKLSQFVFSSRAAVTHCAYLE